MSLFSEQVERVAAQNLDPTTFGTINNLRIPGFAKRWALMGAMQAKYKGKVLSSTFQDPKGWMKMMDQLNTAWEESEFAFRENIDKNPLNKSLLTRLDMIEKNYETRTGLLPKFGKAAEKTATRVWHSFFGATLEGKQFEESASLLSVRGKLGRFGYLFLGGALAHSILTGSLLGSMEGPSELARVYKGDELVPVRRGRWWEGGGTPYEGSDIMYFRPSQYSLLMTRAREKSIWGENEDDISPLRKFFIKNFTYQLEEQNYYSRPYPITSGAFEGVPIIGKFLSATVGRLIKPPKLMHVTDWTRTNPSGQIEFSYSPEPDQPNYDLGGLTPGRPQSPYSTSNLIGEQNYQFRELEGLTGWAKNVMTAAITGSDKFFVQRPMLASAERLTSPIDAFWELQLGGGFFTTEAVRRILPRRRSEIQEYNPILNDMPSWLPPRLHYGDVYSKLEAGYTRLPGPGYASIHPELQGVDPEKYPLAYRYSILADVAEASEQFKRLRTVLYQNRAIGKTTEGENQLIDITDRRLAEKHAYYNFDYVDKNAIDIPLLSAVTRNGYQLGSTAIREAAAPIEFMIPMGFRPTQKLFHNRTPIEQYEIDRLYGSTQAFWDQPIRDWFRPVVTTAAHFMGYNDVPSWKRERNDLNEYFDKLDFLKWMKVAQEAEMAGDLRTKRTALYNAQRTRTGVNPMGNPLGIYQTLPDSDKKYFDAFSYAQGGDRERILEMVPGDQAALYKAIWSRLDAGDQTFSSVAKSEMNPQYLSQQLAATEQYFQTHTMPSPDWIGFNDQVNVGDIKLKYITTLGKDIHEYDLWEREQRMLVRKPYLNDSDAYLVNGGGINRDSIAAGLYNATNNYGGINVSSRYGSNQRTQGSFYINDNQSTSIIESISNVLNN